MLLANSISTRKRKLEAYATEAANPKLSFDKALDRTVGVVPVTNQNRRRGAIAVIGQVDRLLVIERSAMVRAPGTLCFPGGEIERGETEQAALVRELQEELGVAVRPVRRIWQSTTHTGILLHWWQAELLPYQEPMPNPAEVAQVFWMSPAEMAKDARLLLSNRRFLEALGSGVFSLE